MKFRTARFVAALFTAVPALVATVPQVQSRDAITLQDQRDQIIQQQVAAIAAEGRGRIGVAAMDLDGGGQIFVNGDMPFPMASTAKIAVAATFLEQVEKGNYRLDQQFPMMLRVAEKGTPSPEAPLRPGSVMTAQSLMELMITRSHNQATDGLIKVVGGFDNVNRWLTRNGITGQRLDHTMATLVRDDGKVDPAKVIDTRTSSTPRAMIALLAAIDRGGVLSPESRAVLLDTMTRTSTGKTRIRAGVPEGTLVAHKTGTLWGVTDDVGIVRLPDGRHLAVTFFVTGPEGHAAHAKLIARMMRTIYDGYATPLGNGTQDLVRRR
ncbi:MAG: serine hydrolase [Novosphingobium sp. 17-62-19]|uniref:serine hydrolase n=1 Tax=Novosphingobium sp. 17-62-19 TaxID=1970406 RepID=UPI000BCF41DF|nr:serine hydrolase [Novosphingobium sp. 17-62-19]OYX96654.1 MAG: serine hydrolase [Novosphingobium sp. 35-62-5]OZA17238.1 MAG: serine hydrolase [Novosphingobium sp. 17-62-19]HQS98530.1 class A beta-lactamase-related serine hydrolase [Novosphingobium sp.]